MISTIRSKKKKGKNITTHVAGEAENGYRKEIERMRSRCASLGCAILILNENEMHFTALKINRPANSVSIMKISSKGSQ